jgi:long-chain acyl-CoA synthetase
MSEKPWLPFYGDIPASIVYPNDTAFELFERAADEHADRTAVDYLGRRLSYRELHRLVIAAARGLLALGVNRSDRIALMVPNLPHAAVLFYAANRVGALVSFFHAEAGAGEVAAKLSDYAPQWMAITREHVNGLLRLISGEAVRGLLLCDYGDFGKRGKVRALQRMRHRHGVDVDGIRGVAGRSRHGAEDEIESPPVFSWQSFLELGRRRDLVPHRDAHTPDEPAVVLYTGGTTHLALGAVHTDRQLTAVALQTQVQGPLLAGQSVLSVVPFAHGYGIAVAVHAALTAGATTVVVPHSTARSLAREIRRARPEYLIGVPATYAGLVLDRVFRGTSHRSLMGAFCGGDRLPRAVREMFETIVRRRGGAITIREGYGLTETVTACATMPESEMRQGSVGIPYPDTLVAIARPLDPALVGDRPQLPKDAPPAWLGPNELGEILVSGPTVMTSYWRDEEATAAALHTDSEGRVWLRTGDLGRMDGDGFLYFVERIGRSYADEGVEVHPGLTELALSENPEVLEACVTVSAEGTAPRLAAHVAPADPDRDVTWLEERLREAVRSLDEAHRPCRYAFHDRLPRTLSGVIDHGRLAADTRSPSS